MIILALTAILSMVFIHWAIFMLNRPKNVPPGPLPLPLIGSMWPFFLFSDTGKMWEWLHRRYGPAATLYAGCSNVGMQIVIADYDSIMDVVNNREVLDSAANRPLHINKLRGITDGIIWAQWEQSRDRRKWLMNSLKQVGLDGTKMTGHIEDELTKCFSYVDSMGGKPIDSLRMFTEVVSSCILLSVMTRRLDFNDPESVTIYEKGRTFFDAKVWEVLLLPYISTLKLFIRDKSGEGEAEMERILSKWLKAEIERRRPTFNPEAISDTLDAYMAREGQLKNLDFDSFMRSILDTYLGAMDTSAVSTARTLYYLAHMPEEQERLYRDIESVVPPTSYVKNEYIPKLPRLQALLLESRRYGRMIPNSFPRRAATSFQFGPDHCWTMPENGVYILQYYSSYMDEKVFKDPRRFHIDRWLDPSDPTKVLTENESHIMEFGVGRRICPGEPIGRSLVNLFVGSFIQRYKWRLAESNLGFDDATFKLTRVPPPHHLIFEPRL